MMVTIHVNVRYIEVLSADVEAGITVTLTLLLALSVGVVIGVSVAWYVTRCVRDPTSKG